MSDTISTEVNVSLARTGDGGWSLTVQDARSRVRIVQVDMTMADFGSIVGAVHTIRGALINTDSKIGERKEVIGYTLPANWVGAAEWDRRQDEVEEILADELPGWKLIRGEYNHHREESPGRYQFSVVRYTSGKEED